MAQPGTAAEQEAKDGDEPAIPNLELLEFLGSFSTEEGEWIDPQSLLDEDFSILIDIAARLDPAEQEPTSDAEIDTQAENDD